MGTGKIGGLFKFLFVLVIVVLAIGLWRSWFSFSMKSNEVASSTNEMTKVTMTIDRNRVREDAVAVAEAAQKGVEEIKKKAQGLKGDVTTITGEVTDIGKDERRITVERKRGGQIELHVPKKTGVAKGDETLSFKAIKPKDWVSVTYRQTDSTNQVDSITIRQPPRKKGQEKKGSESSEEKAPASEASGKSEPPGQGESP